MSSFDQITARLSSDIEAALDCYTQLGEGCPPRLREAMRYSLLAPGKRLRPLLVLLAAESCGGSIEAALPAAAAVEMIHAYSLVHDDLPLMDNDDLRRGRPTCHKAFDEATAVLAGDALLALAFETLAKRVQPPEIAAACCAALAEAAGACQLVGGQADDVQQSAVSRQPSASSPHSNLLPDHCVAPREGAEDDAAGAEDGPAHLPPSPFPFPPSALEHLRSIHQRKTGALIAVSTKLGGMTARAGPELLTPIDTYGKCLGLAFQIVDDLLDIRSSEMDLGKRVGKDANLGKLTFPGLLGIDQSAQYAAQLIQDACHAILPLGDRAAGLEALARFVLERNR
jgi:geranylgeranyl diphosphate synthase type II